jgi:adiponectin receptor
MGLSSVFPVFHGLCMYGFKALDQQMGIRWVMMEGFLYVVGAVIYAARVPERWAPRKYDLLGASHQIFHFFVVAAAMSHLVGLVKVFFFFFHSFTHTLSPFGRDRICDQYDIIVS